jgi:hypothetical protein
MRKKEYGVDVDVDVGVNSRLKKFERSINDNENEAN